MDTAKFPVPDLASRRGAWKTTSMRVWNALVGTTVKYGGWVLRLFS